MTAQTPQGFDGLSTYLKQILGEASRAPWNRDPKVQEHIANLNCWLVAFSVAQASQARTNGGETRSSFAGALLAEAVLHLDMMTERGQHARALAREVLRGYDEAFRLFGLIEHATAPRHDDGSYHEAANELAQQGLNLMRAGHIGQGQGTPKLAAPKQAAEAHQPTNRENAEAGNVNAIRHVAYGEGWRDGKAEAQAWRPIETAPKNHLAVLTWTPGHGTREAFRDVYWEWYLVGGQQMLGRPTHWMENHAAPGSASRAAEAAE